MLGIEVPATRETEEADPRFLHGKLEEVVVELLEAVLETPTLLVLENTHLTDDASASLMSRLETDLERRPWVVLATRRDLETGYSPSPGLSQRLDLTPIAGSMALDLLVASTGTSLSAAAMSAIVEKAGGNPLFLKALVNAAAHAEDDALPDSIEAVLTKEIDRLPPDGRTLLRCAAVLGMRFSEPMLREMLAATDNPAAGVALASLDGMVEPEGDGQMAVPARADPRGGVRRAPVPVAAALAQVRRPGARGDVGRPRGRLGAALDALLAGGR